MRNMSYYGGLSVSGYDKLFIKQGTNANTIKGGVIMLDPLIFEIIKVGIETEISNPCVFSENEIKIKLTNGMKVIISTEFVI